MLKEKHGQKSQKILEEKNEEHNQETSKSFKEAQKAIVYPTVQDVLDIANDVASATNQRIFPLKDCESKIEAAIARAKSSYFGQEFYPDLFSKAAVMVQSLIINHPFSDGNKRIATITGLQFLEENGIPVEISSSLEEECIELLVGLAQGTVSASELEKWLKEHFSKQGRFSVSKFIGGCINRFAQENIDLENLEECVRNRVKDYLHSIVEVLNSDVYEYLCDTVWRYQLTPISYSDVDRYLGKLVLEVKWTGFDEFISDCGIDENLVYEDYETLTPYGEALDRWWYDESDEVFESYVSKILDRYVDIINSRVAEYEEALDAAAREYEEEHGEEMPLEVFEEFDAVWWNTHDLMVREQDFEYAIEGYPWDELPRLSIKQAQRGLTEDERALFVAVEKGDIDEIKRLLDRGVNVNVQGSGGETPLHTAVLWHPLRRDIIKLLLDHGADPNIQIKGGQASLHVAAFSGHVNTVKLLLDYGADPNIQNRYGYTPLHNAAYHCHTDVVGLLLSRGADPKIRNDEGETPRDTAWKRGCKDVVRLLDEYMHPWDYMPKLSIKQGQRELTEDEKELFEVIDWGDVDKLKELLDKGVSPNIQDKHGCTPLHYTARWGFINKTKLLLEYGADPNAQNRRGRTPLHEAVRRAYIDVVELLLKHGADPNIEDSDGNTPEGLARIMGYSRMVELLDKHMYPWDYMPKLSVKEAWKNLKSIDGTWQEKAHKIEQLLENYKKTPISFWLRPELSTEDAMAIAYLAADNMVGIEPGEDEAMKFFQAVDKVLNDGESWWQRIKEKDPHRYQRLKACKWSLEKVKLYDVGVFPKMGGYPVEWCKGSVVDTARKVLENVYTDNPRWRETTREILSIVPKYITILRYLPPILVPGGWIRKPRYCPGCKVLKWDIDDGNHRAVAAAIAGQDEIYAFVGRPKTEEERFSVVLSKRVLTGLTEDEKELFKAIENGDEFAVMDLLDHGADPEIRNNEGKTPKDIAQEKGYVEIVKLLDEYSYPWDHMPKLSIRKAQGGLTMNGDSWKLFEAVKRNRVATVKRLLDKGVDPNIRDDKGRTLLHYAARKELPVILELLLDRGLDPNIKDDSGQTPLHVAVVWSGSVTRVLLDRGADPNIKDNRGQTPLYRAVDSSYTGTVEMLLEHGADPNVQDKQGRTLLHFAVEQKYVNEKIVEMLLKHGADPNIKDREGRTPVDIVWKRGYNDLVKLLSEYGRPWDFMPKLSIKKV